MQVDVIQEGSMSEILYACFVSTVVATRPTRRMPLDLAKLGNLCKSQCYLLYNTSRILVTIDGVWIGESVYWTLSGRNYKYL
jgi:hypothetical protein